MTKKILGIFILSFGVMTNAAPLRSASLKASIANEVEKATAKWESEDENIGSIWVHSYKDSPESYKFEVTQWKSKTHMVVETEFLCGSEYDESEFFGTCKVDVLKDDSTKNWVPIIESLNNCSCDVEIF